MNRVLKFSFSILLASIFTWSASLVPAAQTQKSNSRARKKTASFKIATFNINYGNPNLKEVVESIKKSNADFVALQETNKTSMKYLRRKLSKRYRFIRFVNRPAAGGFAILSKSKLRKVKFHKQKFGWFGVYTCEVKLAGKKVQIANVHLQASVPRRGESYLKFLARWQKDNETRRKEIAWIYKKLDAKKPAIILGDFNSMPTSSVISYLEKQNFKDCYKAIVPQKKWRETWRWGKLKFRLDYIFASKHFKTKRAKVLQNKSASDHHLVAAELTYNLEK